MSSDLINLIRKDVERIPLPPGGEWTRRRRPAPRRTGRRAITAALSVLVLIVALTGGQVIHALRDRIDTDRAASGTGLVPGTDLVYLADGDGTAQFFQIVGMPKGDRIARVAGQTYVGRAEEGSRMQVSGEVAYLPVAVSGSIPDEHRVYLQPIDLRRGIALGRTELGTVRGSSGLQAVLPGTPPFPAASAAAADGRTVWLVVDSGDRGEVATVSRFAVDATGTLSLGATTTLQSAAGFPSTGATRSRLMPLGADQVAVVREHYLAGGGRDSADWFVLDASLGLRGGDQPRLNVVASFATDSAQRLPLNGLCADLQPDPSGAGWIVLCSDGSGTASGALVFIDGTTFKVDATVPLDRQYGVALAMTATPKGAITILTDRPVLLRVDPRTRTLVDARTVTQRSSWFDQLLPAPALAKSVTAPTVVFSPDARYAYLAAPPDRWWGPLSTIDLTAATVIATNKGIGTALGIGISPDGQRLYVLADDQQGDRSLLLLVPSTLGVAARARGLQDAPTTILAVR